MTAGDAAEMKSFIEKAKNMRGRAAGLVNSAEGADGESGVEAGGKSLAGNIADVEADGVVGEREIVQVVTADFGDRLKLVRDDDVVDVKMFRGQHGALNDAGFLKLLLAQFFYGKKIVQRRSGNHGNVRRGKVHREGDGVRKSITDEGGEREKTGGVVANRTMGREALVYGMDRRHNRVMRALAAVLVAAIVGFGVYELSLKKMPSTDQGTAPTQAISLTGVRSDLLQIAQAERGSIALDSKCVSLDDLISSGALTMNRKERDGYTYAVSCAGSDFQVIAEHPAAAPAAGIRYPKLAIDGTMQVQEIQ